jgi:hypothetical protein
MRLSLTSSESIELTIIITHLTLLHLCLLLLVRLGLHSEFVRLLFLQAHRETDRFFVASGVQLVHCTSGLFHFRRVVFSSQLKSRVGNILVETTALRVNLNLDGAPITSRTHTHTHHTRKHLVY